MLGLVLAAVIGAGLTYFLADYGFVQYRGRLGPDVYILVKLLAGGVVGVLLWAVVARTKR